MQKIIPHLWFDKEAKEAVSLYTSLFENATLHNVTTIHDTPSGDCDIVSFTLAGQNFMAISAGPYFTLNPSISLFVNLTTEEEIFKIWNKLTDGGKILMPYDTYPWAQKYGWVQDKYGVSWQLSLSEHPFNKQTITPSLMFTKKVAGKAKEAIQFYTSLFQNSQVTLEVPYAEGEGDIAGYIKHAHFTLGEQDFMAMDSSMAHDFSFNEAFSFIINCETQEEIDYYWERLSSVPEAEQCGWCKDAYGVSWQIVPIIMNEMMTHGTKEQTARVTKAFLGMKKFDIKTLEEAYAS
jgi:predicted 3-demethylubiquinone-9 3-methyltransferase (glyoxalase superfamily)